MFRALITLLGAKEKAEYHRMRQSLELYLNYLKKLKSNSRHQILSMSLEFHSQNLKSQLNHIMSRMTNNLQAVKEVYNEDDDQTTESYFELMALSVLFKKSYLYEYEVDKRSGIPPHPLLSLVTLYLANLLFHRHEELIHESPIYTTHNLYRLCLEKYIMDNETILKKLDLLLTLIDNEESLFRLQLNYSQNEILILNTILTILACSISFGGYLTGAFGMNLDNTVTLQEERHSFVYVCCFSLMTIVSTFILSLIYFRHKGILPTFVGRGTQEKNHELNIQLS
jgi:ABC-type multidrug transport system fused ATPase/permease subunit